MPAPMVITDVNAFLNALPAYDQSEGTDTLLDQIREINQSMNYYWVGAAFPTGDTTTDLTIGAGKTKTGTIPLPSGSFVTGISHSYDPITSPFGFRFSLYDKGTKGDLVYGKWIKDSLITAGGQLATNISIPPNNANVPNIGPHYLMGPFIVTPPGILQYEIVNLDPTNSILLQLMLDVAVPITKKTLSQQNVSKVK